MKLKYKENQLLLVNFSNSEIHRVRITRVDGIFNGVVHYGIGVVNHKTGELEFGWIPARIFEMFPATEIME